MVRWRWCPSLGGLYSLPAGMSPAYASCSRCTEAWCECSTPPSWFPIPTTSTSITPKLLYRWTASPSNCIFLIPFFPEQWPTWTLWMLAYFPLWKRGLTTMSQQPNSRPSGPRFGLALLSRSPHTHLPAPSLSLAPFLFYLHHSLSLSLFLSLHYLHSFTVINLHPFLFLPPFSPLYAHSLLQ